MIEGSHFRHKQPIYCYSFVVYLLACCFLASCQKGLLIPGRYSIDKQMSYKTMPPIEHWIRFDEDSLFTYHYSAGFHKEVSNGKWHTGERPDEIHLSSSLSDIHNLPIIVHEEVSLDTTTTFVLDISMIPHTKWKLRVNGFDYWFSDNIVQLDHRIIVEEILLIAYLTLPKGDTTIVPSPLRDTFSSNSHIVSDSNSNLFRISFAKPVNFDIYYYTPLFESIRFNKRYIWFKGMKYKRTH